MIYKPRHYQQFTTDLMQDRSCVGALLSMGLGKTVSALTAFNNLMYDSLTVDKVLIIAPKKVTESVWIDEIKKWDHLKHLRISIVLGTEKQRKKALAVKADIYAINRENVAWLVGLYQSAWPFKHIIIDESSSFKAADSVRFKALRTIRPYVERMVLLTGTPASNGLMDLWSQIYLLDQGQRLGKFITHYRDRFFMNIRHKWIPKEGAAEKIYELISDICVSMKSEDYLELPKCTVQDFIVRLSKEEKELYEKFERDRILEIEDVEDITAVNAAVLTNKLLQFANGAIYDEDKKWHELHTAKIEALEEIIESANGQPVIVAYAFKHDLERIKKALKAYAPRTLDKPEDIAEWNEGKIKVLLTHPLSAGHGLNLQFGGHILVWFGNTWSLEQYMQLNKRLDRPGQEMPVLIIRMIVEGTMDEDVIPALEGKAEQQDALMAAVRARIKKYRSK